MPKLLHPKFLSLPEVKAAIKRSELKGDNDEYLTRIANGVWRKAESVMGRELASRTYVHDGTTLHLLDAEHPRELYLPNPPITDVATLKPWPSAGALVEGWDEEYSLNVLTGRIVLVKGLDFWESQAVIECEYTGGFLPPGDAALTTANAHRFGWEDAAADIKDSIIRQVADIFQKRERGMERVTSFSSEGGGTFTVSDADLLPDVRSTWQHHRIGLV
jgi:hypothetical protein